MHPEDPESPARKSTLPIVLSGFTLAGILLFLIFVSGGFFLHVLAYTGIIVLAGLFHYLTWGNAMHQQTEGDREEALRKEELEGQRWD